jgi:hypothetical protein
MNIMKCTKCGKAKPTTEYYTQTKNGYPFRECKECYKARRKAKYDEDPKHITQINLKWWHKQTAERKAEIGRKGWQTPYRKFRATVTRKLRKFRKAHKPMSVDHIIPIIAFWNAGVLDHDLINSPANLRICSLAENRTKNRKIDWSLIEKDPELMRIAELLGLKKEGEQ